MALKTTSSTKEITETKPTAPDVRNEFKTNINGTSANDVLYGNYADNYMYGIEGNDTFMGSDGSDEMHGSDGDDTVNYSNSPKAVTVNLMKGSGKGGYAQGDKYVSVENVKGSQYKDTIFGDNKKNVLDGGHGDDYLAGAGGDDELIGGVGNDILEGGVGEDFLDGGSDIDTASYANATSSVIADLERGGIYGEAFGDTYKSIENLAGSAHSDWLYGDDGANEISGGGAQDFLYGREGNDVLNGEGGDDILDGGEGADVLNGGSGTDEANYKDSDKGVTVRLAGVSEGGTAEGDTYSSVENAVGSDHNDVFYGTAYANTFWGRGGDDVFKGDGGMDHFDGGADSDTVDYRGSDEAVTVNLATGQGDGGDAWGDTYQSIENIYGSEQEENLLIGNDGDNIIKSFGHHDDIEGGAGNDDIYVYGAFETINAGDDDDFIRVIDSKDQDFWESQYLLGTGVRVRDGQLSYRDENGNIIRGPDGNFHTGLVIDGGEGEDTVDFGLSNWVNEGTSALSDHGGVSVDLSAIRFSFEGHHYNGETSSNTGNPLGDDHVTKGWITNVENVYGTQYEDYIEGNASDNKFVGGGSDDVLRGEEGNDELRGDAGDDTLDGGADDDTLNGGAGADELIGGEGEDTADYLGSALGVNVSLTSNIGTEGDAAGDTLSGIENLSGSDEGDFLEGNSDANVIMGNDGADIIDGAGGNDILYGGADGDTFLFGSEFYFDDSTVLIMDFDASEDVVDLTHLPGFESAQDVVDQLDQLGPDAVLHYEGAMLGFVGVPVSELTADNFLV